MRNTCILQMSISQYTLTKCIVDFKYGNKLVFKRARFLPDKDVVVPNLGFWCNGPLEALEILSTQVVGS